MKSLKEYHRRHRARDEILERDMNFWAFRLKNVEWFKCRFLYAKNPRKRLRTEMRFLGKYNRRIYYSYEWIKEM